MIPIRYDTFDTVHIPSGNKIAFWFDIMVLKEDIHDLHYISGPFPDTSTLDTCILVFSPEFLTLFPHLIYSLCFHT